MVNQARPLLGQISISFISGASFCGGWEGGNKGRETEGREREGGNEGGR